jgi:O-antigen ligase
MRRLEVASAVSLTRLMFSGDVKSSPRLSWVPVDLTGLAMVLVAVAVGLTILWERPVVVPVGGLVIVATLLPGFIVGTANPYTPHDRIAVLTSIYTAACAFVLLSTASRRRIWLWTLVAAGILVVPLLGTSREGTLSVGGQGATTSAAQLLGLVIVILVVLVISDRIQGHASIFLTAAAVVVLGYMLIGTGARGPTLALALALAAGLLLVRRDLVGRAAVAAVVVVLAWVVLLVAGYGGAERMRLAASGGLGSSPRVALWREALAAIPTTPVGCGWGNFWSVLTPGARLDSGYIQHAHNTVLEAFVEGGWVAGIAIAAFIVLGLRRQLFSARGNPDEAALFAVALFLVACSMVSGTVGDDRAMFAVLAAAFAGSAERGPAEVGRSLLGGVGRGRRPAPRHGALSRPTALLRSGVQLSLPPRWVRGSPG